jgi:ribosome maturation factor RimP
VSEDLEDFSKIVLVGEIKEAAPKLFQIINNLGFRIVRIIMIEGSIKVLQFMIERKNLSDITIKECTKLSRIISVFLDEIDVIEDGYNLEISSPGLERPILEYRDFKRFIGSKVKIKLKNKYEKKSKFIGMIKECEKNKITLIDSKDSEVITIPFTLVDDANLVFSDLGYKNLRG